MARVIVGNILPAHFDAVDLSVLNNLFATHRQPNYYAGDLRNIGLRDDRSEFFGSGFRYDSQGVPFSGTVAAFQESYAGELIIRYEGVSIPVIQFLAWVVNGQSQEALNTILRDADTITGSPFSDYIIGYGGNDLIDLGSGDDLGFGGSGNDVVIGGPGVDSLQIAGAHVDYNIVIWAGTVAAVPRSNATLAVDGVDKGLGIELLYSAAKTARSRWAQITSRHWSTSRPMLIFRAPSARTQPLVSTITSTTGCSSGARRHSMPSNMSHHIGI